MKVDAASVSEAVSALERLAVQAISAPPALAAPQDTPVAPGADWRDILFDTPRGQANAAGMEPASRSSGGGRGRGSLRPAPVIDPNEDPAIEAARVSRRRRTARLRRGPGLIALNLTAMIDVLFQILVFFVCTTRSLHGEGVFKLDVPPMKAGAALDGAADPAADPLAVEEPPLRIRIGPESSPQRITLSPPIATPRDVEELYHFMRSSQRSAGRQGLFPPDHPIEILPDGDCRWEDVVGAFNALVRAHYTNVGFGKGS